MQVWQQQKATACSRTHPVVSELIVSMFQETFLEFGHLSGRNRDRSKEKSKRELHGYHNSAIDKQCNCERRQKEPRHRTTSRCAAIENQRVSAFHYGRKTAKKIDGKTRCTAPNETDRKRLRRTSFSSLRNFTLTSIQQYCVHMTKEKDDSSRQLHQGHGHSPKQKF